MPGMAEPDIAIDIVSSGSMSEVRDTPPDHFAPRPRLAGLTLSLIGLDATVTVCAAFLCYILFDYPAGSIASSSVVIPMACLTVCLTLSFFERGLYSPPEIVSRQLPWRKIILAWLQAKTWPRGWIAWARRCADHGCRRSWF
jgi:hypothetical protein